MNYCAARPSASRLARIRQNDLLRKYLGRARRLIGIELVDFTDVPAGIETHNTDLAHLPLPDGVVNIIISRSVFEHLADPRAVCAKFSRVLRPGGVVIFLTANLWDYGTLIARLVPNWFHARIVAKSTVALWRTLFPTSTARLRAAILARLDSCHAAQAVSVMDSPHRVASGRSCPIKSFGREVK